MTWSRLQHLHHLQNQFPNLLMAHPALKFCLKLWPGAEHSNKWSRPHTFWGAHPFWQTRHFGINGVPLIALSVRKWPFVKKKWPGAPAKPVRAVVFFLSTQIRHCILWKNKNKKKFVCPTLYVNSPKMAFYHKSKPPGGFPGFLTKTKNLGIFFSFTY